MWKPLIKQVHTHLTWFQRSVLKGNVPFCGVLFWPCLILYFNKEKDCLWWKESWDLNLELTVFSPFLPLPGGQQLVLWLTAAPPSVCRPLTYWVDKHPRASGVLPTWPCTCLHIAQCLCGRRTGQSSLAQQALPSCPVEGRGGGDCRTLWKCHDWASELNCLHPSPQVGIYPPPNEGPFVFCVFLFMWACLIRKLFSVVCLPKSWKPSFHCLKNSNLITEPNWLLNTCTLQDTFILFLSFFFTQGIISPRDCPPSFCRSSANSMASITLDNRQEEGLGGGGRGMGLSWQQS